MTSFFSEHLSAAKYVKAHAMEEQEIEEGFKAIDTKFRADILNALLREVQVLTFSIYNKLSTVVTCVFGSRLVRRGQMETTGINSTSTYLDKVNQFMSEVLTQYQNIRGAQGALTQVIIGNNGSGKTTLMKLMQGLYTIRSGRIKIGDNEIGKVKLCGIRSRFAYILQNDNLFSGTIRENICYGCDREVMQEEVEQAARMAGAHDFIISFPDGYNTVLTEAGMNLSGGQRKRISFARAFLQDCDYFLLDEAGANLDNKSYGIIFRSLKEKMKEKTVVFIAHEMDEIMTADYILVMSRGTVEAFGTHEELLKTSEIYRDYIARIGK